jgi:hypothetical protein
MAKFGYTSKRKMDPINGRKYSTEYFKQSPRERSRTQQHIDRCLQELGNLALADEESMAAIKAPLPNFKRKETNGYYSVLDIIGDMSDQMQKGHDIPSGMLGRWNRLFAGTGNEIDMVPERELPPPTNYNNLFGDDE